MATKLDRFLEKMTKRWAGQRRDYRHEEEDLEDQLEKLRRKRAKLDNAMNALDLDDLVRMRILTEDEAEEFDEIYAGLDPEARKRVEIDLEEWMLEWLHG